MNFKIEKLEDSINKLKRYINEIEGNEVKCERLEKFLMHSVQTNEESVVYKKSNLAIIKNLAEILLKFEKEKFFVDKYFKVTIFSSVDFY